VKGFLRDIYATYSETLELIHAYFRFQTVGDNLRNTTTRSDVMAITQRVKLDNDVLPNKTGVIGKTSVPFPNNHGKLLPSECYCQFREWHAVFSTMKSGQTPEQTAWIHRFKFNFDVISPGGWPHKN